MKSISEKHLIIQEHLIHPIDLSATDSVKLEVALKRCSYPKKINHPTLNPIKFTITIPFYLTTLEGNKREELSIPIQVKTTTSSMSGIAAEINASVTKTIQSEFLILAHLGPADFYQENMKFQMIYRTQTGRFYINNPYDGRLKEDHICTMSNIQDNDIWSALGFQQMHNGAEVKLPAEATTAPIYDNFCHLMIVTAPDLIDPQDVGGRLLPMLAPIPIAQDEVTLRRERASTYRKRPVYKKVRTTRISDIRIEFLNQDLQPIPDPGQEQLDITLHFRQCY